MGKWAARLAQASPLLAAVSVPVKALCGPFSGDGDSEEKTSTPPYVGTDETDKRGVLAVLAVGVQGGAGIFLPLPTQRGNSSSLAAECWTDADIEAFLARRSRLMRWGWSEVDAERLAERLVSRDRDTDDRVSCIDCRHYRPGRCSNHRSAGLTVADLGRDLASTLQRCGGFTELGGLL